MNLRALLVTVSALVLIWTAVAAVMRATESRTSTPEKVLNLMNTAPWLDGKEISDAGRKKRLDDIIDQVNHLDYDQQHMMEQDSDREIRKRFHESLTKNEQQRFIQETVEHHFRSVMKAFNKMTREDRQHIIDQAMKDMDRNPEGRTNMEKLKEEDQKVFDTVVEKGLSAYYQDANTQTKLDLEPLMERMQARLQSMHH